MNPIHHLAAGYICLSMNCYGPLARAQVTFKTVSSLLPRTTIGVVVGDKSRCHCLHNSIEILNTEACLYFSEKFCMNNGSY